MGTNRREFLKGAFWMGATAFAAGCMNPGLGFGAGGAMQGFRRKPMSRIRVGVIGLGDRGAPAVKRLCKIPGVEVSAICDKKDIRIAESLKIIADHNRPVPKTFNGLEGWKALCDMDDLDVVYVCTPWDLHVPNAVRAIKNGKIPLVEVPAAFTVDQCWELVELSEKLGIPCMQLENCCYGEIEMLEFNMAKLGVLGELVHAEGAYIHDLRGMCKLGKFGEAEWRYDENLVHKGNRYPTHGLVPLCLTMDINRGDCFDYLVSLESNQANFDFWKKANLEKDNPRLKDFAEMGDMNTTLIKTKLGKSIMVQHDVSSPRPYSRANFISGTKGTVGDYPFRVVIEDQVGVGGHHWFDDAKAQEVREKYKHPVWKQIGEIAQKVGGHGGMDFVMDLRWAYCLQNGLPLDMDVYDLASTSCLCELTEQSVRGRSKSIDIPDFTRGGWKTAKPLDVVSFDMSKIHI